MNTIRLVVPPIKCEGCVETIQTALKNRPGVHARGRISLTFVTVPPALPESGCGTKTSAFFGSRELLAVPKRYLEWRYGRGERDARGLLPEL